MQRRNLKDYIPNDLFDKSASASFIPGSKSKVGNSLLKQQLSDGKESEKQIDSTIKKPKEEFKDEKFGADRKSQQKGSDWLPAEIKARKEKNISPGPKVVLAHKDQANSFVPAEKAPKPKDEKQTKSMMPGSRPLLGK